MKEIMYQFSQQELTELANELIRSYINSTNIPTDIEPESVVVPDLLMTVKEISEKLGICTAAVYQTCKRYAIYPKKKGLYNFSEIFNILPYNKRYKLK